MRPQALLFQGQALSEAVYIFHNGNGRQAAHTQPVAHFVKKRIDFRAFRPYVGKQDKVDGDTALVHPHQHGGAVYAAAEGYDIHGCFLSGRSRKPPKRIEMFLPVAGIDTGVFDG